MPTMSGPQALVGALIAEGVDTVFGLPGFQMMAAFDAFHEDRDRIRLLHTRHEQSTTFMADGYAKATGRVGVAMVVPGPGALFAAAGLGTAYSASSPVLLVSGQIPSEHLGKGQGHLHELEEQLDAMRPITKWAHRVSAVEEIPGAVHEAFRHLTTGRPRPVELEVPMDILEDIGEAALLEPESYARPAGSPSDVRRAAELLVGSSKPAIIAGGGAILADASQELLQVAERLQAPVMTSAEGKGVVPEDHYLAVGTNYSGMGPWKRVIWESDVVLAVGTRLHTDDVRIAGRTKIVQIDIDAAESGRSHRQRSACNPTPGRV